MVCEGPPRPRQLLVRRRGSFFEDPFFREAWDDYSHAVRRIVDRFNRGWVSPSDRLRDSQYHSMYRTLRSARLNYSAHSARFKEEGNVYKLVMDVREFVGGDITVRTAGGTVSVRGKLEVSSEGEEKRRANGRFDDDTSSSISGKSSSAKTLHRRFTLPVDANCEKVESMLSRDAILTITIPKRTDVHYIPVNIEGEDKENESCVESKKTHEGTRQPSVKRPSDSPPAPTRKKSQDESVASRRRRRKSWRDDERDHSKFKPKDFTSEDLTATKLESDKEKNRDESNGKRKRNVEKKKEEENLSSSRPRRRDKSKYEEVQEINIPIRIDKSEPSDKVFRPSSIHESSGNYSDISNDLKNSSENKQESDVEMEKSSEINERKMSLKGDTIFVNTNDLSTRPKNSSVLKKDYENFSKPKETNDKDQERKSFSSTLRNLLFRSKGEDKKENEEDGKKEDRERSETIIFPRRKSENQIKGDISENVVKNDIWSKRDSGSEVTLNDHFDKRDSVPSISISRESPASESPDQLGEDIKINDSNKHLKNIEKQECTQKFPLIDRSNVSKESNSEEGSPKENNLGAPKINLFDRPSSPVSPGSKIVKVGEDPSLMEEGIFKDCWSDFSNTLQDVLSRLQELSSELGHSKVLATTPSAESSPPVANEDFASGKDSSKCSSKDFSDDPESIPTNINKDISTHGYSNDVGGVGRCKGGSKDDSESAHISVRTGHGHRKADDLEDDDQKSKDTPQTQPAQKALKSAQEDAPQIHNTWVNVEFPKSERPSSLNLRSVASPLDKSSPEGQQSKASFVSSSRPNSLLLSDTAPGSLLESLRKNSPVESLQEDFLRRNTASKSSQLKEVYVPVDVDEEKAVPVGGNTKKEERSNSLSPSDAQSNIEPEESESESGNTRALGNSAQCKLWVENSDFNGSESKNRKYDENVFVNKEPILNDLSKSEIYLKDDLGEHSSTSSIFEPNIDDSPESNLTDDDDDDSSLPENLLHSRFSFPAEESNNATKVASSSILSAKEEGNKRTQPLAVGGVTTRQNVTNSDVTESVFGANNSHPEIPSDDAMVCERHLPPSSRVPRRGAKEESLRFSRVNRPRDLLLKEVGGDAEVLRESNGDMGGVLSRGRKALSRKNSESLSENSVTNSPSACSPSPSRKTKPRCPLPQEEVPVPSYVRLRTEPSKRNSGFAHVNSDNVRRMRDVWGSKQEPSKPPQNPVRSPKVTPSPTRLSSKRLSEINDRKSPARSLRGESPYGSDLPSEKGRSSPLRRASPPPDGRNSPHFSKGHNRLFKDSSPSPSSPKLPQSYRATAPSSNSGSRRASQASQASQASLDRSSPVPSSPCRRCSRSARESPSPSPSIETKPRFNYGSLTSEEKKRSKASPSNSFRRDSMKSNSAEKAPQASKVHQKIFKRLRDASLQPDSEAICFKEEQDKYKMVLDVEEYVPGEIEVLQDDLVLTVKGRVERKDPGGHVSVKTFHRTFNIPKNSREEEIDSALSKDGILTIYVPKKRERVIKIELVD